MYMYNLIKLQKHDAFYQSREGGNFQSNVLMLICNAIRRRQLRIIILLSKKKWKKPKACMHLYKITKSKSDGTPSQSKIILNDPSYIWALLLNDPSKKIWAWPLPIIVGVDDTQRDLTISEKEP